METNIQHINERFGVVFYAEAKDGDEPLSLNTKESKWISIQELSEDGNADLEWKQTDFYKWGTYIDQGGFIYPMSFLSNESS